MSEVIKITHGNGLVTEIPAKQISGTSFVRGRNPYRFLVYERCGLRVAWKISHFPSKQAADEQRHHIEREYSRIMSR